jgi:uncharacterized membrane protein YfcA
MNTFVVGVLIFFAIISGVAKAGFGFGAGIILNPILTLFVPSATAVTMLAPILWFSNFAGARTHRKSIQWTLVKKLLPMALIGTLLGSGILTYVNDELLKPRIGLIAIFMGLLLFLSRKKTKGEEEAPQPKKGILYQLGAFTSGFVGAVANSGGLPLIVLFLNDRSIDKHAFTANIAVLLAIMDSVKILSYLSLGILSIRDLLFVV